MFRVPILNDEEEDSASTTSHDTFFSMASQADTNMGGGQDPDLQAQAHAQANLAALLAQMREELGTQIRNEIRAELAAAQLQPQVQLPPVAAVGPPGAGRAKMKWPSWEGNTELLPVWRQQILAKLRNDPTTLPDREAIVVTIQGLLPVSHQPRTVGWISREATRPLAMNEERWDHSSFLAYIVERCGDPEAATVAARRLDLLRQGRRQPFREFLQEFEVLQAKAESAGEVWTDGSKVRALQKTLNADLSSWMVSVRDAPAQDYTGYTKVVSDVAGRAEALPGRTLVNENDVARRSYFATAVSGSTLVPAPRAVAQSPEPWMRMATRS
jgi:hypothetical protein